MSRPIISYDDITLPYDSQEGVKPSSSKPPVAKKRKHNNQRKGSNSGRKSYNGQAYAASFTSGISDKGWGAMELGGGEYEEEESRELTHDEIWDDSALVDAWEAAQQEYEMYHGKDKDWKAEPIKKSPLWYNVPIDPSTKQVNGPSSSKAVETSVPLAATQAAEDVEYDSRPLNFETFVPTHDPTLPTAAPTEAQYLPNIPAGAMVSQDEAFSRAMSAMYWGGYWTAMYHCQRSAAQSGNANNDVGNDDEDEGTEEDDGYVSTQR